MRDWVSCAAAAGPQVSAPVPVSPGPVYDPVPIDKTTAVRTCALARVDGGSALTHNATADAQGTRVLVCACAAATAACDPRVCPRV